MGAPLGNKYALGANGGRPSHYDSPEELMAACIDYFDWCVAEGVKTTITGLALYLGFCSRSSLDDYCKRSDDFSYIVKRSKLAVENGYELSGQTIDIFALKNMGWKDNMANDITLNGSITAITGMQFKDESNLRSESSAEGSVQEMGG